MREITSIEDQVNGLRRFVLTTLRGNDIGLAVDARAIELAGSPARLLREYGYDVKTILLPVYQRNRHIGSLPNTWDWQTQRETLMYRPRATDFVREGDKWIADPMLGPGDLLHAGVSFSGDMPKPEW